MNIQQPASGRQLRPSPAQRGDCACVAGARLCRHTRAAASAPPQGGWRVVMASSAAASVRPPRPKKEPQTLVIPKNAAEEQKLKLERLMKNPVRQRADGPPESHLLRFRHLRTPAGPLSPPLNSRTQNPKSRVRPEEEVGCPKDSELSPAFTLEPSLGEGLWGGFPCFKALSSLTV